MSRMAKDALGRRARRQFSEEFKEGAVRLVLDEGKTVGAVARELDLTPSALGPKHRTTRDRPAYPNKLTRRSQHDLVGRVFNVYHPTVSRSKVQKYTGVAR
jgi:hypothetical protein